MRGAQFGPSEPKLDLPFKKKSFPTQMLLNMAASAEIWFDGDLWLLDVARSGQISTRIRPQLRSEAIRSGVANESEI